MERYRFLKNYRASRKKLKENLLQYKINFFLCKTETAGEAAKSSILMILRLLH